MENDEATMRVAETRSPHHDCLNFSVSFTFCLEISLFAVAKVDPVTGCSAFWRWRLQPRVSVFSRLGPPRAIIVLNNFDDEGVGCCWLGTDACKDGSIKSVFVFVHGR